MIWNGSPLMRNGSPAMGAACCCTSGPCCPSWDAPTTLYVQIDTTCAVLDGIEFTLTGAGGTARSWTGTVDFGCDTYDFTLECNPSGFGTPEYTWRLNGERNYTQFDECYEGLVGSNAFEMVATDANVTCDQFTVWFYEQITGVACSSSVSTFYVSENPFP